MRRAPARATSESAAPAHRICRRLVYTRSPRRRRFSARVGEIFPDRAERRREGISWSAAGRKVRQVTVRQTTPITAKNPRSQMALIRFTMSEPKPMTVVRAEITSGSHTREGAHDDLVGRRSGAHLLVVARHHVDCVRAAD